MRRHFSLGWVLLTTILLILTSVPVYGAYTPAAGEEAGHRMQKLGIIQGRPGGLYLNDEITRAELVTVIVRAFGKEEDAKMLKGSTIFPDIQNHWASGNIAMAVALVEKAGSDPIGMPNGKFEPDAKLTPAQSVAFLMKFLGQKADAGKTWPNNYLDAAVEKGLITAEDKALIAPMLNENATRGLVFYLFDRAFYNYKFPDNTTFYTRYVDFIAPILNLDAPPNVTVDSKVSISGRAYDASEVFVGTTKVTPNAEGWFSTDVELPEQREFMFTVTAVDIAGNRTEKVLRISRVTGSVAAVEATMASRELKVGSSTDVAVIVKDQFGKVIRDADYTVEIQGDIGTYAGGKFTAGKKTGHGRIIVASGEAAPVIIGVTVVAGDLARIVVQQPAYSLPVGETYKLTAKGLDSFGNEIPLSNIVWGATSGTIDSQGKYKATSSGSITVSARAGQLEGTVTFNVFGDSTNAQVGGPGGSTGTTPPKNLPMGGGPYILVTETESYLGKLTASTTEAQSVCNPEGEYGKASSPLSIWNKSGSFGSASSPDSPWNPSGTKPPIIISAGKKLGRLSVNSALSDVVLSPENLCEQLKALNW